MLFFPLGKRLAAFVPDASAALSAGRAACRPECQVVSHNLFPNSTLRLAGWPAACPDKLADRRGGHENHRHSSWLVGVCPRTYTKPSFTLFVTKIPDCHGGRQAGRGIGQTSIRAANPLAKEPGSLGAREPGSQGAWEPGSQGAKEPGSRGAGEPGSQGAREPGSQGAWEPGRQLAKPGR